jgi:hypothetical protein
MGCLVSDGIDNPCGYRSGGITNIWVANRSEISAITYGGTAGRVDAITMVATKKFYAIGFSKGFGSYDQTGGSANGQKTVMQTITFQTSDSTEETKTAYEAIHLADDLVFVIRDANGERKIFGQISGLEATEVKNLSGLKADDFAGFSAIIAGSNPGFAIQLEDSVVLTV